MLKKTIIILACGALIAPVAFAQTRSTHEKTSNNYDGSDHGDGNGHQNDD
jgi:hypothetical protein